LPKKKKNCTGPPPLEQFNSFGGNIGKKLPLGAQMEKTSFGRPKEIKTSFFKAPKGFFFLLVPQRKLFFPFEVPKERKLLRGRRAGAFFFFFWQFFSTCEKITQFLEFCKYQGGKI
jgi:hypothetical protein